MKNWRRELLDPANRFAVSLVGLAGRLKMRPDWAICGVVLPNHLFYCVLEGALAARIDGANRTIGAGELLWVAPGVPLWLERVEAAELVVLRFRVDATRADGSAIAPPREIGIWSVAPPAQFLLERLVETAAAPADDQAARAYLLALCHELERGDAAPNSGILTPAQIAAVRACLSQARHNWPSPGDLARAAQLSPPYFARVFGRTFGRNPRRFLLEERMRLASVKLLESSDSVGQIARALGYADVFAFSRQFKAVQGQSPSAFRAAHALDAV